MDWLEHPNITNGYRFENPNSMMLLANGDFIIVEKGQINILDENFCSLQPAIMGKFYGLKEVQNGEVHTLEENIDREDKKIALKKLVKHQKKYYWHET